MKTTKIYMMVHVLAPPMAEEASAMNRKKYEEMRSAPSKQGNNIFDRNIDRRIDL